MVWTILVPSDVCVEMLCLGNTMPVNTIQYNTKCQREPVRSVNLLGMFQARNQKGNLINHARAGMSDAGVDHILFSETADA